MASALKNAAYSEPKCAAKASAWVDAASSAQKKKSASAEGRHRSSMPQSGWERVTASATREERQRDSIPKVPLT